jgi:hypothetical protein
MGRFKAAQVDDLVAAMGLLVEWNHRRPIPAIDAPSRIPARSVCEPRRQWPCRSATRGRWRGLLSGSAGKDKVRLPLRPPKVAIRPRWLRWPSASRHRMRSVAPGGLAGCPCGQHTYVCAAARGRPSPGLRRSGEREIPNICYARHGCNGRRRRVGRLLVASVTRGCAQLGAAP